VNISLFVILIHDTINKNVNSADKLRHPRTDAYSAEQVLLNKQQIWSGGACLHWYTLVP